MSVVDRREELFENILRLRRAARELPGNVDIAAVRAGLESELGETVSRRLAARVLGVSHTALQRWVAAGDVPVVYARSGRFEVPVAALLELREAVDADRAKGAGRYPLAATIARQRDAAQALRVTDSDGPYGDQDPHDRGRARSLAYHRAVARQLRRPMVDEARHVLSRWRAQGRIDARYANRWEQLLSRPVHELRQVLVEEGLDADDLRQNSPFAGLLSEAERRRILDLVR